MKKKIKIAVAIIVVGAGAALFVETISRSLFFYSDAPAAAPVFLSPSSSPATSSGVTSFTPGPTSSRTQYSDPARLIIPSLAIDASVQYLGINTLGNMMAPSNFTDVGWYKYGPAPGNVGSAVVDGHVDNGLGLAGVFKNIDTLKVGDALEVRTVNGSLLHFTIYNVELYPYKSVPADLLFNKNDGAYLNLITCDGAWVAGQDTYDHRLVIFSRLDN
jgi:sortase A